LHKSVDSKNLEIVRHLLDENVDINARTNNGLTPLIIACYHGCLDLIELLLTYGAKANIRTKNVRIFEKKFLVFFDFPFFS